MKLQNLVSPHISFHLLFIAHRVFTWLRDAVVMSAHNWPAHHWVISSSVVRASNYCTEGRVACENIRFSSLFAAGGVSLKVVAQFPSVIQNFFCILLSTHINSFIIVLNPRQKKKKIMHEWRKQKINLESGISLLAHTGTSQPAINLFRYTRH